VTVDNKQQLVLDAVVGKLVCIYVFYEAFLYTNLNKRAI
jgi:hypothetical protein